MFIDKDKTKKMLAFVENEHFRYRRDPHARASKDEVALTSDFILSINGRQGPLLKQMTKDFTAFFEKCMGVRIKTGRGGKKQIIFRLNAHPENPGKKDESFVIESCNGRIVVSANHERGLLHASHYLERKSAFRGGPFVKKGRFVKKPAFNPRISQTIFCLPEEDITYPVMLTDRYMSLMSHFGINGIFIYTVLWDYCRNSSVPALNTGDYRNNIAALRKFCIRAAKYGIDIYLHMNTRTFSPDATVFKRRPRARGARLNVHAEMGDAYSLCSSDKDVLGCYNEAFQNLFKEIPELGGTIIIVGGECFFHCFSRPKPPLKGGTSCPHCAGRNPSRDVARMVNGIAKGVHAANRDKEVFVWPYSAFTWSGEKDFAQEEFIKYLDKDISFLSNFDTPFLCRFGGAEANLIDYNILNTGPSVQFERQSKALAKKGMPHYAKTESSTDPAFFFLPYIPVHYRWFKRYKSLIRNNVPGFISKWRFYGFTGSIPEELLSELTWDKTLRADEILFEIAKRDFGDVSRNILEGWKRLSAAWEKIPVSHLLFGERHFYMKGPLYLGPAHPVIFDAQKRYGLSRKFFTVRGDAGELMSKEEVDKLEGDAPPKFSSDLLFTYPFSPAVVESGMKHAIEAWDKGVEVIAHALGKNPGKRAVMEVNICKDISCHLHSAYNITKFYRIRDEFFGCSGSENILEQKIDALIQALNDEIENAKSILPVLEGDFRVGYGHCYGQVYDIEMVKEKIRQCLYVRDVELPDIKTGILFHIYGKYVPETTKI